MIHVFTHIKLPSMLFHLPLITVVKLVKLPSICISLLLLHHFLSWISVAMKSDRKFFSDCVFAEIYPAHPSPHCMTPTTPTSPSLPIPIPHYAQISHPFADMKPPALPLTVEGFNGFPSMFTAFHPQLGSNGCAPVSPLSHHSELDGSSDVDMAEMPNGLTSNIFKSRKGNLNDP